MDDLNERLQRQRLEREQQRFDDMRLPGDAAPSLPETSVQDGGPCFPITRIEIADFSAPANATRALVASVRARAECYRIGDIQALQRQLTNRLIGRGYVTSRVLLPEQNLASGVLQLVLVSGRVEGVEVEPANARQVNMALPSRADALLNLRDLEQAIENLERVTGQSASIDLKPGSEQAASVLVASLAKPDPVAGFVSVTDKRFGHDNHAVANLSLETGGIWEWPDRIRLSLNEDLDNLVAEEAWGMGLDYDLGVGYWLYTFNAGRQAYTKLITPALQTFEATGKTDSMQASATRILYRSSSARVSAGGYLAYQDIGNYFQGALLNVSSYRQKKTGISVDAMRLWGRYQFSASVSAEHIWSAGAAANLPGGISIADTDTDKYALYVSAARALAWRNGRMQLRTSSQYTVHQLFPVSQFSLTALVPGYEDISVSGNSGSSASLEYSQLWPLWQGRLSIRPYTAVHGGWIPGNDNEAGFERLMARSLGAAITLQRFNLNLDCSWPWDSRSTIQSGNEYVLRSTLSYSF